MFGGGKPSGGGKLSGGGKPSGGGKASNYISTVELLEGGKLSMTTKATAPEGDGGATQIRGQRTSLR
jgi:hypothetical protein